VLYAALVAGTLLCAGMAIRAKRLLAAALWLAGVSALVSILLYRLGAHEVAVIELSVGAGLVTVLFVFAIGLAGEEAMEARPVLPKPVAWGLILVSAILLGWMTLPWQAGEGGPAEQASFATLLWQDRGLDVLVQIVLIFSGVLGVLGLLAETRVPVERWIVEKPAAPSTPPAPARPASQPAPQATPKEVHV
jgi:NADH:ubiquinone oxidoreductase subunit 6 (subunit J)